MSTDATTRGLTYQGEPLARVETPGSIRELSDAVAGETSSILIAGKGSRLAFGNSGGPFDFALSMRRLNGVIHYEPEDLTIAVEPGITVAELNAVLAERNQTLPFDDRDPDNSTLGGTYASGLGGPRRLAYGSVKDWVLGVEVMDPDGEVTKSGGMVVKNVTGYDLPRLHFGAHGAFGIVTRLNLKVFPRPQEARSIVVTYKDLADAHRAGLAVLSSQLEPTSLLVSREYEWKLSICCEGAAASIERRVEDVMHVVRTVADPESVIVTDTRTDALAPFWGVSTLDGSVAVARLSVPPSGQAQVLGLASMMPDSRFCADLGSGVIYVAGPPSIEWRQSVSEAAARPVFLSLPPELKRDIDVFGGMDLPNAQLVTRLKTAFDPARRFNRGRFVLGL